LLSRGGLDNRAASLSRGEHAELDRASDECVETGSDVPARAECGRGADDRRPRPVMKLAIDLRLLTRRESE
jgi:hypothetical protein